MLTREYQNPWRETNSDDNFDRLSVENVTCVIASRKKTMFRGVFVQRTIMRGPDLREPRNVGVAETQLIMSLRRERSFRTRENDCLRVRGGSPRGI